MYSDTLLALERAHLLQLLVWGGASILIGTAVLAVLALRRTHSPLLASFALQCVVWGIAEAALGGIRLYTLVPRDGTAAATLDRLLYLNVGLDAGYAAVGLTIALGGWFLGRQLAAIGAGMGVIAHALALLVLHLRFIIALSSSA